LFFSSAGGNYEVRAASTQQTVNVSDHTPVTCTARIIRFGSVWCSQE
jgi:hypothetical protein